MCSKSSKGQVGTEKYSPFLKLVKYGCNSVAIVSLIPDSDNNVKLLS